MPGWTLDESGRLKRETIPRMGRRLRGWDYKRPGYYVITIVKADRRSNDFGQVLVKLPRLAIKELVRSPNEGEWISLEDAKKFNFNVDDIEAKVEFSPLGRAVFNHFRRMGEFTPGLEPVYCAVMPDHLHLLLKVVTPLNRPIGNAIAGFKTGCEKIYKSLGGEGRLFAEGFVDEVVLRAGQLKTEFNYLLDNPRRFAVKKLFPWLFKVIRKIKVNFRLAPKEQAGRESIEVQLAPTAPAVGWFSAIGNHFLLERHSFHQIQCSRRFFAYQRDSRGNLIKDAPPAVVTSEFEDRLSSAIDAAQKGAVLISPCISQGEREIARRAFEAGYSVITLANKGFSPLYKPGGKLFETCANGNLLMLAPIGWPHQVAEKPVTRIDALILNRIAQLIAGDGAAKIDYKGVSMIGIDEGVITVTSENE